MDISNGVAAITLCYTCGQMLADGEAHNFQGSHHQQTIDRLDKIAELLEQILDYLKEEGRRE